MLLKQLKHFTRESWSELRGLCYYKIEVITTDVLWSSSWTRGSIWCTACKTETTGSPRHSFSFLFCLPGTWRFMRNSVGVSRKAEDVYPTGAPGPCSYWFRVAHYFYFFIQVVFGNLKLFVVYVYFPCLVYFLGLYIIFISARILDPFITLAIHGPFCTLKVRRRSYMTVWDSLYCNVILQSGQSDRGDGQEMLN